MDKNNIDKTRFIVHAPIDLIICFQCSSNVRVKNS